MKSIAYLPASNGSANASLMTVTNIRSAGANTIKVNTVANAPVKFAGTMGTPHTFTDPVTSETITIISEASAVDFFGSISGSDVIIDQIAAGYTDLGSKVGDIIVIKPITEGQNNLYNIIAQSHNDDGSIKDAAIVYNPLAVDHINSGGIWTALTGLNAGMTALVAYQAGLRGSISAVASRAFTLNKDTYVDVLRTRVGYVDTFSLVYTEVANGAAAPALAANSIRLAKVVTNGTNVTSVTQRGTDSLFNFIYPASPNAAELGSKPYNATLTGWSSVTIQQTRYIKQGKLVTVFLYIQGTSVSNPTTVSLPVPPSTDVTYYEGQMGLAIDNGAAVGPGRWSVDNAATAPNPASVVTLMTNQAGSNFVTSGSKVVRAIIQYEAA